MTMEACLIVVAYGLAIIAVTYLQNKYLKFCAVLIVTAISASLLAHKAPGFHNILLYEHVKVSGNGIFYSMWLNFDKTLLLLLFFYYYKKRSQVSGFISSLQTSLSLSLVGITAVLLPAIMIGSIMWEPKVPAILPTWIALNLLVVASEEMLFRGFIQNYLSEILSWSRYGRIISLLIASILFGLIHYAGGLAYIALSFIAGVFYGSAFMLTGRIGSSIIVHFLLNLTHIMLFTYPILEGTSNR